MKKVIYINLIDSINCRDTSKEIGLYGTTMTLERFVNLWKQYCALARGLTEYGVGGRFLDFLRSLYYDERDVWEVKPTTYINQ